MKNPPGAGDCSIKMMKTEIKNQRLLKLTDHVLGRIPRKNPLDGSLLSDWDIIKKQVKAIVEVYAFAEKGIRFGRAEYLLSVRRRGKHTIELAYSKLKGLSDAAIIGVIAHELGHVLVVHHYGEVDAGETALDVEIEADEYAELMGFGAEINVMRSEIE